MKNKILYWAPRILAMLIIGLFVLLSMDVFDGNYGFFGTLLALFMHLIPAFAVGIVTWVAWKWNLIGGCIFIALGLIYMILVGGKIEIIAQLIISLPLFLTGILFLLNKNLK